MALNTNNESGANLGSGFSIQSYSDTGALLSTPLTFQRDSGAAIFNAVGAAGFPLVITPGTCHIVLNKAGGVSQTVIDGANNGVLRWQIVLGNNQAEGGGNVGSGFGIARYSDAGALLDQPIQIARANGVCTFSASIVNGPSDRSLKENIEPLQAFARQGAVATRRVAKYDGEEADRSA